MESYKLNYKLSKKIYKHHKQKIRLHMCYSNIYLIRNCAELNGYNYKIAYGFLLDNENIFTRHCFILLENGAIVDPTFFAFAEKEETAEYFIIKSFSLMDYMEAVVKNEYNLSLEHLLMNKEIELHSKLEKSGYERNIYEDDEFIMRRLKSANMQI